MASKKKKPGDNTIAQNRRARHDYFIEDRFEAGLALTGWEVKALRAQRGQLTESYVVFHRDEAWLHGVQIQPLPQASTHFVTEPTRTRKLLLHRRELNKLREATEQKGYTICGHRSLLEAALGKMRNRHCQG